jgi:hypothetical protein
MNGKIVVVLTVLTVFMAAIPTGADADVRRQTTERRPSVVDIGEPYPIPANRLEREARRITGLGEYLDAYGYPDYAEIQEVAPEEPWDTYEVRTYYLQPNLEVDFGHVIVSPALANYGVRKFLGQITPEKRHEIEVILAARLAPPPPSTEAPALEAPPAVSQPEEQPVSGLSESLVARVEAAAERAAKAADLAAEQSEAAVRAADRTVNIVEKMEHSVGPKHRSP